jgi:hypothetical protein
MNTCPSKASNFILMEEEEVVEEEEELPEDLLPIMVLDFKVLPNHHPMLTTNTQQPMLSTEVDASSLTPTKV